MSLTILFIVFVALLLSTNLSFAFAQSQSSDYEQGRSFSEIMFNPWEGGDSNLFMTSQDRQNGFFYELNGSTLSEPHGFISDNLNYSGNSIGLSIGNFSAFRNDTQVSFTFSLHGENGASPEVRYVLGRSPNVDGWFRDQLFEPIAPNSNATISLKGLSESDGYTLNRIVITVEKETTIRNLSFEIILT